MARPKMKKPDELIDAMNLLTHTTQMVKSVKMRESVYVRLQEIKRKDNSMKSIDAVITSLLVFYMLKGGE